MRGRPDPSGPDENDAGAGHGTACVHWGGTGILRNLQAVSGVCGFGGQRASSRLRECTLTGGEGGRGSEWVYRDIYGRLQSERRGDISGDDLRIYRVLYF